MTLGSSRNSMASGGPTKASCLRPKLFRPTVAHTTCRYSGRTPPARSRRHCCGDIWCVAAIKVRAKRAHPQARLDFRRTRRLEGRRLRRARRRALSRVLQVSEQLPPIYLRRFGRPAVEMWTRIQLALELIMKRASVLPSYSSRRPAWLPAL
jgi:hypothetical protein